MRSVASVSDALGRVVGAGSVDLGQDQPERIGAKARAQVRAPRLALDQVADLAQDAIAVGAAVLGVDPGEAVDVEEGESERAAVALNARELGLERLVEVALVAKAGERIAQREAVQPLGRGDQLVLGDLALGDVDDVRDEVQRRAVGVADERGVQQAPDDRAVSVQVALLASRARASRRR